MLLAYRPMYGKLAPMSAAEDLTHAVWIDLLRPEAAEAGRVKGLVPEIPTLADMEEIEISSRLYREAGFEYMTVMVPGLADGDQRITGPVTFILGPQSLITVRHHTPRPFETYATRADKVGLGCDRPERVFLGLVEEIIGRIADLLEASGRALDAVTRKVFTPIVGGPSSALLQSALETAGQQGDLVSNCRLSLLTIERALGFFLLTLEERGVAEALRPSVNGHLRDIGSLEVHGDYLSSRVAQATDATLGMINLAQNNTVRIVSVVAVLFLPPTLIASVYGMNFVSMPELHQAWGYPVAVGLMIGSSALAYFVCRLKKWL